MTGSTLTVWKFETPHGATDAVRVLEDMQRENLLTILDYATVSWKEGKEKPITKQGSPTSSTAALGGAFWGMLFGLIFFVPLLGAAVGAASGAIAGSMADVGIDDGFIKKLRAEITPGTSALFLMTSGTVLDRVKDRFAAQHPSDLIYTNLSEEQDSALRQVFGSEMTDTRRRVTPQVPADSDARDLLRTTLTVWHYNSAMGASAGEVRLRDLEERGALTVIDAITVLWMPAASKPRIGRFRSRTGARARRGAVLGGLAGTLVLAPVAGAAVGAGVGAIAGRLRHTGIEEAFLHEIERRLVPGSSALLVLSENADLDAIRPIIERGRSRGDVTLMHALVRDDAPQSLRDLLDLVPSYPFDSTASTAPQDVQPSGPLLPSQGPAPLRGRKETP